MDYFQGVVVEFLRADRAVFVNTECCIQLNHHANPDSSGAHWYCDALALNLRSNEVYLCEVSYAQKLGALTKRLEGWARDWPRLRQALVRDSSVDASWHVRPWLFVPGEFRELANEIVAKLSNTGDAPGQMPTPHVTALESVLPWKYKSWNRFDNAMTEPGVCPQPVSAALRDSKA